MFGDPYNSSSSSVGQSSMMSPSSLSPGTNRQDQGRRQKLKELMRPIFQESYFTAEYCLLGTVQVNQPSKLSGLYAIPSAQSAFLWFGVLFVHSGPWCEGVFRFILRFPESFPDSTTTNNLPTVQFTGAYPKSHPLIHPGRGSFDLKRYYKAYSRSSHHIWQLLKTVRKIFYKLEIQQGPSYPNQAAADLFLANQEQFKRKCEDDVKSNKARLYEEDLSFSSDPNYIKFTRGREFVREGGNDSSYSSWNSLSSGIGLSFMKERDKGSLPPLPTRNKV